MIYENLLTHEWDGIDKLIIFPQALTEWARRKIRGFVAAGGEIITYPDVATLLQPQETSPLSSPAFSQ